MKRRGWGIVAAGLLAGCAPPFAEVGGSAKLFDQGFEVDGPSGWYRATGVREGLLLTRDGLPLQLIRIERTPVEQELPYMNGKLVRGIALSHVAEIEMDELRSTPGVNHFELLETRPASRGGRQGYRILCVWKTRDRLRVKRLQYAILDGKWVYRLIHQAAARHYFDRDLPTFE